MTNHLYDKRANTYETDEQYARCISTGISLVTNKIKVVTGKSPHAWMWPYDTANDTVLNLAKKHGYKMVFTLNEGLVNATFLDDIPRVLISDNPSLKCFASRVAQIREPQTTHVIHVDLDYMYDKDPTQQKRNIDKLIQRVYDMRISHVFLQAYAGPQGDGSIHEVYFPNRWLPMHANLFNYISWWLQTWAGVTVYAWMLILVFDLDVPTPRITAWSPETGHTAINHENCVRLSPWDSEARKRITEIYGDLVKHASFKDILFHGDAFLTDFEDTSPEALATCCAAGLPGSIGQICNNPQAFEHWTRLKSEILIDFIKQLTRTVRNIRGPQV